MTLDMLNKATVDTPTAGRTALFAGIDGELRRKDAAGVVTLLSAVPPLPGSSVLMASRIVGDTSITLQAAPPATLEGRGILIIDPFNANCELRTFGAVTDAVVTVAALSKAHAANVPVLWTTDTAFSAMLFGAKPDGTTDNYTAFKNGLTAVDGIGGGTFIIPLGTSIVGLTGSASSATWLGVGDNTTVAGYGPGSVLKVKDANGHFRAVFDHLYVSNPLKKVIYRDFTLDLNGGTNPVAVGSDLLISNQWRFGIRVGNGDDVLVDHVTFLNAENCTNVIVANGTTLTNVRVQNCTFETGGAAVLLDQSVIYLGTSAGGMSYVTNNVFYAATPGLFGAGCAIELHGSNQHVEGNEVRNLGMGVYCASSRADNVNSNRRILNNRMTGVLRGINLLALFTGSSFLQDFILEDLHIKGNTIELDRDSWADSFPDQPCEGIQLNSGSNGTIKDLLISQNTVRFLDYTEATLDGGGNPIDGSIAGIKYRSDATHAGKWHENVDISDNVIENAPAAGLHFGGGANMLVKGFKFNHNRVIRLGMSPLATSIYFPTSLRCGAYLGTGNLEDAELIDNQFIDDDAATQHQYIGINDLVTSVVGGRIYDNTVRNVTGSPTVYQHAATADASSWTIRMRGLGAPGFWAKIGSTWQDTTTNGRLYTQYTTPAGNGWQRTSMLLAGTTANRPAAPIVGTMYFDTQINLVIVYNGTNWKNIADVAGATV